MIKGIAYPRCEHARKIPPRLAKKLQAVRRKMTKKWSIEMDGYPGPGIDQERSRAGTDHRCRYDERGLL
jgi:hypothetical protein